MKHFSGAFVVIVASLFGSMPPIIAAENADPRLVIQTVNTPRTFPQISTKAAWEERAESIRNQILVSCGLWPMPEKTPLNARVSGKINREGYSVEKVAFESYPGVFVCGNLYRPLGKGTGPFPGILNPHGHWDNGRMANEKEGSIAARCIQFARQGMIAFSYDMFGYNDSFFSGTEALPGKTIKFYERHRSFATNSTNLLWNINLMGLQTWNSIRALDWLESLPEVDKTRLACTGESGGGTQTFILAAIDQRLASSAPVVMVSHSMQGGCSCENAPGLRIQYSNMEIAACAAPRHQMLVGATGDWTRDTEKVEGPAIETIYRLYDASGKFRHSVFDFRHNYNQTSREAVYAFFGEVLKPRTPLSKELPYTKEPDEDLRVFPDGTLPPSARKESELILYLIAETKKQLVTLRPKDRKGLVAFKQSMLPAWKQTLQVSLDFQTVEQPVYLKTTTNYTVEKLIIGRKEVGDRIPAMLFTPSSKTQRKSVILVHPSGTSAFLDKGNTPKDMAAQLISKGFPVLLIDTFLTGESENFEISNGRLQAELFFSTYNVTDTQARVQDIITAAGFLEKKRRLGKVIVCGQENAGLWALLAAPGVDAVVADGNALDLDLDENLLAPDLFIPGLKKIGGFESAVLLAAPNPFYFHHAGPGLSKTSVEPAYGPQKEFLVIEETKASEDRLVEWMAGLK